jgi:PTH1 family peptidyl-tRNA hydrolase
MPAAVERPLRLVAGLGNPGREYEDTRHNAGFLVLDSLAARLGLAWNFSKAWQALYGRGADGCMYLKPQTFMNLSGRSVQGAAQFYKVDAAEMLIVFDDLALPLGQLRLRREGSAGGQNGMQSVLEHLGTSAVPRLRVGIGAATSGNMVDHVLGKFSPTEVEPWQAAIARAADAVVHAREHGLAAAMNLFNRAPLESAEPSPATTTRQST